MSAHIHDPSHAVPSPTAVPDLSGLQRSVSRVHGWEPLRVEGIIPSEIRGTLIRTGPGLLERFGRRLAHAFEADGALMAVRLDEGAAQGAVRVVQGAGYRHEQAAGRPMYGSAAPRWRRLLNNLRGQAKATGNTNVIRWQGRTYALMEGAGPVEIDAATLETLGESDLQGAVTGAFSAHPHRVASLGTTFNFGQVWGRRPGLDLYALPDTGAAKKFGHVEIPINAMVHDFAVTERHMVFVICPAKLRLGKALTASADFDQYFAWDPTLDAELIVVPLDAPERPLRIPVPARWVFHLCNAHERDGELVVDWVQYPDFNVFDALSTNNPDASVLQPHVQRLVVDLRRGRLHSDEILWDHACDFPVLPAADVGRAYSTCWFATEGADSNGGIARLDPTTGVVDAWQAGPGRSVSEAVLVPGADQARPDQGWLLAFVHDGWARESWLCVLDAETPSRGPVAKAWMGQALPTTYHGVFVD